MALEDSASPVLLDTERSRAVLPDNKKHRALTEASEVKTIEDSKAKIGALKNTEAQEEAASPVSSSSGINEEIMSKSLEEHKKSLSNSIVEQNKLTSNITEEHEISMSNSTVEHNELVSNNTEEHEISMSNSTVEQDKPMSSSTAGDNVSVSKSTESSRTNSPLKVYGNGHQNSMSNSPHTVYGNGYESSMSNSPHQIYGNGDEASKVFGNGHSKSFNHVRIDHLASPFSVKRLSYSPRQVMNGEINHSPSVDFGQDISEKAAAVKSFFKEHGIVVQNAVRRLSGRLEDLSLFMDRDTSPVPSPQNDFNDYSLLNGYIRKLKGRITLFTKSGCLDSRAVRRFLRRKALSFVEINIDIFPLRRIELEQRTGSNIVPQVYFNEVLIGGLDDLNALDSKELEFKITKILGRECPSNAPEAPVYGDNDPADVKFDEFAEVVRKLKGKVEIKDRFFKMRLFTRCFTGLDAVKIFEEDQSCDREKAIEFGKQLSAKHFFHHVLDENMFEDGNHFYRLLEHDPVVTSKCYNFNGHINEMEIPSPQDIEASLRKFTHGIVDSYVSDDGKRVDYRSISMSEEFRRYLKMTQDLHRFDVSQFSREEKLAFFINLYNMMTIHAIIILGHPSGWLDRRKLFGEFYYLIGGYPYSLSDIQNGILRANQRSSYQLMKPFGLKDKRLQMALPKPEPLVHFALTTGSLSSPAIKCYSPSAVDAELTAAARAYFLDGGVEVNMGTKTVSLGKTIEWFSADFGKTEADILRWLIYYLEPDMSDKVLELLSENEFKLVYQTYDWTCNSINLLCL